MMRCNRKPVVFDGRFDISPAAIGVGLAVIVGGAIWAGVVAGAGSWDGRTSSFLAAGMFALLAGVFGGPVAWLLKVRRDVDRLAAADELCSLFCMDRAGLLRHAESRGIHPRYIVNGCPYYEPADFGDGERLLRSSASPADTESMLLRPAAESDSRPDRLLRPSHTDSNHIREQRLWN